MKLMWCAAVVVAGTVSVAAQGGGLERQKPAGKADASGTVTLTGCLQADTNKSTFWLSDAGTADQQKGTAGAGTTGAAASGGKVDQMKKTAAAETYRLNATSSVALDKHVGHKVEIRGTFEGAGAGAAARGTSGAAADRPATGGAAVGADTKHLENARQVNVTALKHISPVCEAGKQ